MPLLLREARIDKVVKVKSPEAIAMIKLLSPKLGLFIGTSSGDNVVAVLRTFGKFEPGSRAITSLFRVAVPNAIIPLNSCCRSLILCHSGSNFLLSYSLPIMRFQSLPLLTYLFLIAVSAVSAAPSHVKGGVAVELKVFPASIQSGIPFWVAVKMTHQPQWHSYWKNPGIGYTTSVTWELPFGFTAEDIQWPTPYVVHDTMGTATGYGYEKTSVLLMKITPPENLPTTATVKIAARVKWLACKKVCIPGDAKVDFLLPVKSELAAESPDADEIKASLAALPAPSGDWTASAIRNKKSITLKLTSKNAQVHLPKNPHFFDDDGLLDYAAPQEVKIDNGVVLITAKLSAGAKPDAALVPGIVSSEDGWGADQSYCGIVVAPTIATETATSTGSSASFIGMLALAFIGGLILNLMPCVFPVLGIKILSFVKQSGYERGKIVAHGFVFAAGVLLSFWALAGGVLVLRAGGAQLGWGFQLQSPSFVFGVAVFLLIFALNMSGLFEVGLATTGAGASLQMKEGLAGPFFTGALATLVATPCSAPFLAPALGAAFVLPPLKSVLVFTAIALGLSVPYLLLSIFPSGVKFLPKPGSWMEMFKQFMAFPLYGTVGWLLWVLAGQTSGDDYALLRITFGFVLIAMAAWAYDRFGQTYGKKGWRLFGRVAALLLLGAGLAVGWPKTAPTATLDAGRYQVVWEKWSPEAVQAARAAGKFIYVDFTARWCATCQTNKAIVFHSDDVLEELKKKSVVLFRGDWTNRNPAITAELARWNRSAVPFNLIYAPGKKDPLVLPELLTPGKVLDAFSQAGADGRSLLR